MFAGYQPQHQASMRDGLSSLDASMFHAYHLGIKSVARTTFSSVVRPAGEPPEMIKPLEPRVRENDVGAPGLGGIGAILL